MSQATISSTVTEDNHLSWKAKGIFQYLWFTAGQPNYKFIVKELSRHAKDGTEAMQSGLQELEDRNYLQRKAYKDNQGKFKGFKWILNDGETIKIKYPKEGK